MHAEPGSARAPTETIEVDTRAWRTEADRILGFWDERLVADRDASVLTTDMRRAFNAWLRGNGHNEWAKELFGPRFIQHSETVRHGVEERYVRNMDGLSRDPWATTEPPAKARVHRGVRFRRATDDRGHDAADQAASESVPSVPTLREIGSPPGGRLGVFRGVGTLGTPRDMISKRARHTVTRVRAP